MIWALHGAVGMPEDWRAFSSEMSGVRSLDLWGITGGVSKSLQETGDAIAGEVSRVDDSPVLLGYSMGGRLALHALLARPELWKAAIIVSAHPGLSDANERSQRREKDARWAELARSGEWSAFLEKWENQGVLTGGQMPDRMPLAAHRAAVAQSFIDWSLGAQSDLTNNLTRISCPVLWLTGERDEKFTRLAELAVPNLPRASHHVISSCGHRVPWEKPGEFAEACRQFLTAIT